MNCYNIFAGYLTHVHRADDFIVLVHIMDTPSLPMFSIKGKYFSLMGQMWSFLHKEGYPDPPHKSFHRFTKFWPIRPLQINFANPYRSEVRVQCRLIKVTHASTYIVIDDALQLPWFGCSVDSGGLAMPWICTPLRSGNERMHRQTEPIPNRWSGRNWITFGPSHFPNTPSKHNYFQITRNLFKEHKMIIRHPGFISIQQNTLN